MPLWGTMLMLLACFDLKSSLKLLTNLFKTKIWTIIDNKCIIMWLWEYYMYYHIQFYVLKVIFNWYFNGKSITDGGTLQHLWCLIKCHIISKDMSKEELEAFILLPKLTWQQQQCIISEEEEGEGLRTGYTRVGWILSVVCIVYCSSVNSAGTFVYFF